MKMIKLYGVSWCPDCDKAKKLLGRFKIDYQWFDIDKDSASAQKVENLSEGKRIIPVLEFEDNSFLIDPSEEKLIKKLNLLGSGEHNFHTLAIVGGGPTGLTTSIYTTREGIHTAIFEGKILGGQAAVTYKVDNYPGFPQGVGGAELAQNISQQAERFGAEIISSQVKNIKRENGYLVISTDKQEHLAKAVILAMGTSYKKLGVPGEEENIGKGVHFCATCDGPFYKEKDIIVIGGGNSALQESVFLTRFVRNVTMVTNSEKLTASKTLIDSVNKRTNIKVLFNKASERIEKEGGKIKLLVKDKETQSNETLETDGIFVFIGLKPNTEWLKESRVELDKRGFVKTADNFETSMPGVFAAGDCRSGATTQIASAVGEGAAAALMVRKYLNQIG